MQRFAKSLVTAVFFLLAFLGRTSAQDSPGSHPGVFLAPGYLSKAANLAAAEMLGSIKAYTHAAFPNQPLAAAPNCMMAHDALSVDTVSFSSLLVTPLNTSVNSTVVRVAVQGVTPLQTTTGWFQVQCQYWGAFTGSLQLPQNGTVAFTVTFEPSLTFDIEVVITPQGTLKTMPPALRSNVRAQPTYAYRSQGFALDAFVAHHFGTTLVNAIESEITALVSYPSPFASSFANQVSAALSIYQFMCGTPSVLDTTTLALWMQPGCAPPSASANVSTSLLLDHDLLLLIPSSSGEQTKSADPLRVAIQQMMPQWRKRVESAPLPSSCTAGIPCPPTMNVTTALSVAFSECVVCYPDNGVYTEFSAVVTMLP